MTYDVLVIIVVINVVFTLLLWRQVGNKSNRGLKLNKKVSTALWHSDPIVPKHDPPNTKFSSSADDIEQQFLADFRDFADVVNWWLADEFRASRFRLQDLPNSYVTLHSDHL